VYPGAPELCATVGVDNDCDGDADEATDPTTWYSDFDGDGYGDNDSGTVACSPPGDEWIQLPGDACPADADKLVPGACGCGVEDRDADLDGVADCNDNCPDAGNPGQEDCDADGYGDACSGEPDCNGNGQPDSCDISGGQSADVDGDGVPDSCQDDCNLNGLPDSYEIAQGLSEDCDNNGLPNECEDGSTGGDTGNMGPVGAGQPVERILLAQTDASTAVRVRVEVLGDLDGANEFLTLTFNNVAVGGDLFRLDASECPSKPDVAEFDVPVSQWNQIIDASTNVGQVRVRLVASAAVSASQCPGGSTRVTVLYGGPGYDCDGDGQPDSCQIAAGELADFDSNRVPDCCESGESCEPGNYPLEWRAEDGGNGHWYMAVRPFGTVTNWSVAESYASVRGGYLVTVTSAGEQELIERLFAGSESCQGDRNGIFLGGRQAPGNAPSVGWSWVTGEPWSYTNWAATEPNDFAGFAEDYLMLVTEDMRWYDIVLGGAYQTCAYSAVVEWSADCNGDGLVDYGQIVRGEFVDVDRNGVPDICECRADVNRNGVVDGVDLAAVLGAWGTAGGGGLFTDISGNGVVDGTDLAFILSGWGACR
jgi:hypothetical protein